MEASIVMKNKNIAKFIFERLLRGLFFSIGAVIMVSVLPSRGDRPAYAVTPKLIFVVAILGFMVGCLLPVPKFTPKEY
jgi:hypothetical protein